MRMWEKSEKFTLINHALSYGALTFMRVTVFLNFK